MPAAQIQIVIFAVIAAFVLFQLYNVLGKKVGRQPQEDAKIPALAPGEPAAPARPALDSITMAAISGLRARDPNFDANKFLDGSRQAYETIVRAYASGDRDGLKPLLASTVMESFETGIAAREVRGETEQVEFVHPPRADLESATVEGDRAIAKVRFLAEIRSTVIPPAGEATPGAPGDDRIEERRTAELWTFERTLGAADPNWVLARVEPANA